jgi:hypothetical protein
MVSQERSTDILPVFDYHLPGETPVLLSLAFANVPSILSMKCVWPELGMIPMAKF